MRKPLARLAFLWLLTGLAANAQEPAETVPPPRDLCQPSIPSPNRTTGFAAAEDGNRYISIAGQHKIYKLNSGGDLTVIAGTGVAGFNGDNLAATDTQLDSPRGLYLDTAGNLYFADFGNARLRKLDAGTGTVTTIAGTGAKGSDGDGDLAFNATLKTPAAVTADTAGNLLIADCGGARVRRVAADSGLISTVALDDGLDSFSAPYGLAADADGANFVADNGTVFKSDGGKLKKAAAAAVVLGPSGVFYAPGFRQISYPVEASPVVLAADLDWAPVSCPAPGTNPGSTECSAAARLQVNLQRLPAKSTIEVKPFAPSETIASWTLEEIQFETAAGTGTVSLVETTLPIVLTTASGPVPFDIDVPLSAVRVKMTVRGSIQIDTSNYKFTLSADLFP